jgi:hypothetical protein
MKPRQPKPVSYTLLTREDHEPIYARLDAIIAAHHREIRFARIAIAWCTSWKKPDVDGRQTLGKCRKASDLDRELASFDFVILLQREFWLNDTVTNAQRDALLDHELCHATVRIDPVTDDPAEDERGRIIYRIRKHDIEEFGEVVERHGLWKHDLEAFARSLARSKQASLLPEAVAQGDAR